MIIDQLPLLGGDVESNDEIPIERGTTSYKTTQAALVKSATDAAAAAQTSANNVASSLATYVRPNLLDNWYFVGGGSQLGYCVFPVNQRGQTSYSNTGYTIDRWKIWSNTQIAVNSDSLSLSAGNAATGFFQYFNKSPVPIGCSFTFSVLTAGGEIFSVTGVYNGAGMLSSTPTSWGRLQVNLSPNITATDTAVSVWVNANSSVNIVAAKFEIGSAQTLAHQKGTSWVLNEVPNYAEELAKCQAYYLHHVGYASVGFLSDTGSAYVNIVTPSTMAKTPTLEVVQYNNLIHGTTIEPITRASVSALRKNAVTVEVGVATTGVFELCMTADFTVNLSAE